MIALENLDYSIAQVVHNFGAAAVVGGAVFALYPAAQAMGPAQVSLAGRDRVGSSGTKRHGVRRGQLLFLRQTTRYTRHSFSCVAD